MSQIGSDWVRLGQIRSYRLGQNGSDWVGMGQIGSDRLGRNESDWDPEKHTNAKMRDH